MRRIKHARVERLALCKRGKNGLRTLFKSDGTAEYATLTKGNEKGELLTVMWPKGLADADGDFADTDQAIKSMTSSLIANGAKLDIEHDGKVLPPEAAYVTEVFTIQPDDPRFEGWQDYDGNVADVTGGAAVAIQIDDPSLRAAYRDGEWDGVSLFGPAAVEQVDIVAASQRVAARMGGQQENDMNDKELQAALDAQEAKFATLIKSAVAEALATKAEPKADPKPEANADEPKPEAKPTFTGDVKDPQALADYENALAGFEMRKAVASGDMTSGDIAKMRKAMQEAPITTAELNEAGIEAKDDDADEVKVLQRQLFKAQKHTNVPARTPVDEVDELAKAQETEAHEIAKIMNANLGNVPDAGGMRIHG